MDDFLEVYFPDYSYQITRSKADKLLFGSCYHHWLVSREMSFLESTPSSVCMSLFPQRSIFAVVFFFELGLVPREGWGSFLRADGNILGPWKVPGTPQIMPSSG